MTEALRCDLTLDNVFRKAHSTPVPTGVPLIDSIWGVRPYRRNLYDVYELYRDTLPTHMQDFKGIPQGSVLEMAGDSGSGKTFLAYHTAALCLLRTCNHIPGVFDGASRHLRNVAFVDAGEHFFFKLNDEPLSHSAYLSFSPTTNRWTSLPCNIFPHSSSKY